jgi:glutamate synthase domain-containing protein 3
MILTGSPRARWVLENWAALLPMFVKVFPHDYKRVLAQTRPAVPAPVFAPTQTEARQVLHG